MKKYIISSQLLLVSILVQAQSTTINLQDFAKKFNVITTSVPFLQISPDARSGGMADAGVAISADANAVHWNSAKLAFADKKASIGLASAPWLKTLVPDVWLYYLSGYKKIDNKSAFGGSMRYFSLGSINFTDINNNSLGTFTPSEFALDGCYSRKLSSKFSVGINLRFIVSNLAGRVVLQGGQQAKAGIAGAGDISFYYKDDHKLNGQDASFSWGLNITNIGNKITYTNSQNRDFIPTNLRTGVYEKIKLDDHNDIGFTVELSKLLVPTPPKRDINTNIIAGRDNNVSVPQGMFQSFYDAP
ncbi:MAG: type IX secretion system outer membrane channel protein PorV, partial [Bacteroidetes bacterium]|nr:type IX secretion system outer membrane channel protein PorV [Bacteroidota bacterium]